MAQNNVTFNDKENLNPIVDRDKQIVAEDINELKSVINDNADNAENRLTEVEDNKADKPDSALENNIPLFDNGRQLKDSGKSFEDTLSDDPNKIPNSEIVKGIDDRLTTNESNTNANTGDITALDGRVTVNEGKIQNLEDNQVTGVITYQTFAELPVTGVSNISYKVENDPDSALNGYYSWVTSAYVKAADLANGVVEEGNVDAVSGGTVHTAIEELGVDNIDSKLSDTLIKYNATLGDRTDGIPLGDGTIGGNGGQIAAYGTYKIDISNVRDILPTGTVDVSNPGFYVLEIYDSTDTRIYEDIQPNGKEINVNELTDPSFVLIAVDKTADTLEVYTTENSLTENFIQENIDTFNDRTKVLKTECAPGNSLNLANVCMQCHLVTKAIVTGTTSSDDYVPFFPAGYDFKKDYNFGVKNDDLVGYGITSIEQGDYTRSSIPQDSDGYYNGDGFTIGFWIDINHIDVSTGFVKVFDATGGGSQFSRDELIVGAEKTNDKGFFVQVKDSLESTGDYETTYYYIQIQVPDTATNTRMNIGVIIDGSTNTPYMIHNYTAINGVVDINPYIEYPTLPSLFKSNMIGKTMAATGDSNGSGGVGSFKRLSWASRYLGMPVVQANVGGWSMQGRVLTNEANYYGWLYYHKWRDQILAEECDIYYFNQCTNDGYKARPGGYPDNTGGNDYGTYGDGSVEGTQKVDEIYTDTFAALLEAGDLNATYEVDGELLPLYDICREFMTTVGCTGAFIRKVTESQPNALCIVDSTMYAISYANLLKGAFSSGGTVLSNVYEQNTDFSSLLLPPYLLADEDVNGYPTTYISNGTLDGGTPVTDVDGSSFIGDGNNYQLYYFYAYDLYGKDPDVDEITEEENEAIALACHNYYETETGTYGRVTPYNILPNIDDDYFNTVKREEYLKSIAKLRTHMNVPFIDTGGYTGLTRWNIGSVSDDPAHFSLRGHYLLGRYITGQINELDIPLSSDFIEAYGDGFPDIN